MVEKTLYKVVVGLACGDTVTFDDSETEGVGATAYGQIGHDFHIIDGTKETYIPFNCVCKVEVEKTSTQIEYRDDNCIEE